MDYRSFGTVQWLYFQGQVWTGMGEIRRTVWGTIELEKKKMLLYHVAEDASMINASSC